MKTIVYIDGFNLYYGRLKHTPYKWLNLYELFQKQLLPSLVPGFDLIKVKFFTAPIKAKFSRHGHVALHSQQKYHKALKTLFGEQIEIIEGSYSAREANLIQHCEKLDLNKTHRVWRLEEKKTDVNIALQMYRDVVKEQCEQVILCTNDTDLEPALSLIKSDFPHISIGLVIPSPPEKRKAQTELSKLAKWTRHHISDNELANVQMPAVIPTTKKAVFKPDYW